MKIRETLGDHFPMYVGYPVLGRFGLGHSLLAWARCYIWCKDNGVPMLAPRWRYLRIGPYLRREADKRAYHKLFLSEGYITGVKRLAYLLSARRLPSHEVSGPLPTKGPPAVIVFTNDVARNERYFRHIASRYSDIKRELLRITRKDQIPSIPVGEGFIGIHVRCGDFGIAEDLCELESGRNVRIPIGWFVEMLRGLRERIGCSAPAIVFSDGPRQYLQPLIEEGNVSLSNGPSAIYDMFLLSFAGVIISSGSGFSMWASYLDQTPRICFPGQRRERVIAHAETESEPECESSGDLDDKFVSHVARRLASYPLHIAKIPK